MFFFFCPLSQLSDNHCNDCNGNNIAPLNDPEILSGDPVHRDWPGPDFIQCEIYKNIFQRNPEAKDIKVKPVPFAIVQIKRMIFIFTLPNLKTDPLPPIPLTHERYFDLILSSDIE